MQQLVQLQLQLEPVAISHCSSNGKVGAGLLHRIAPIWGGGRKGVYASASLLVHIRIFAPTSLRLNGTSEVRGKEGGWLSSNESAHHIFRSCNENCNRCQPTTTTATTAKGGSEHMKMKMIRFYDYAFAECARNAHVQRGWVERRGRARG